MNLKLNNINITKNKQNLLSLKELGIDKLFLTYPQNSVGINSITINKLISNIQSDKNGQLNLENLINIESNDEDKKDQNTKPWNITLKSFNIKDSNLKYKDLKNKINLSTNNINIALDNFKFNENKLSLSELKLKNTKLAFNQDDQNDIKIDNISLDSKDLELINSDIKIALADISLSKLSLYNKENQLNIDTNKTIISIIDSSFIENNLNIKTLSLKEPLISLIDKKNNQTIDANELGINIDNISYKDEALNINRLSLKEPLISLIDKKNNQTIKAKNIDINIDKIYQKNNQLKILKSLIDKPNISITLGKNTNNKKIKDKQTQNKTTKKAENNSFKFNIGPVKINDMKMTFEDKNLPIEFKTNITELNGEFSRLNSNSSKPTKLNLEGKVDKYGYTKITGTVDINDIKLLTNTNILFKNIAIKNFTPYSGKFIGREIDEGKLNLDLKYNIKKSDLDAKNSIIISDIKLGKNVKSPDAISLPLELAIALLEDSDGVIDINLPIKGNIDDPEFSIAPIVWKAFTNLIVKAVTAPFSLLGALFNIDEEKLKTVQFEVGKDNIIASEKESLDAIAKILKEKNKLAINIEPVYDLVEDRKALQLIKVDKLIEKEMTNYSKGDKYKLALEELYKSNDFELSLKDLEKSFIKKDKNDKSYLDKENYLLKIKNLLASKQSVSKDELITLSKRRVESIKEYLIKTKNVNEKSIKFLETKEAKSSKNKWIHFKLTVSTK